MNLRTKIARLEALVPVVPEVEPGLFGKLARRTGHLLTGPELEALSGWAFDSGMEQRRLNGGKYPEPCSASQQIQWHRDIIATVEARYRREGREFPPPPWENGKGGSVLAVEQRPATSPLRCTICGSKAEEDAPMQDPAVVKDYTPDPCPLCACRRAVA